MNFKRRTIVFEAADIEAESAFWAGLLDGTVEQKETWHNVWADGDWHLAVQLAPGYVPPTWPDGASSQQVHLDFYLEDLEAAHEKAIKLGARLLKSADDPGARTGFRVYADPAGHIFCMAWP
ncbi:VOC family protein [Actinoplanes sp. NBRC 103695]|uniref:VOC family protein n=1 Tax=Actinoplanes sp. NBRC 103695 TaxID=3032202 RepID=UPI0024A0A59F|nr:VOC family protein [Actinoplanes sp. NBRC 103695]GLZ00530.1 glyoxalase [Actinoplanes sp. NBRC 103695]